MASLGSADEHRHTAANSHEAVVQALLDAGADPKTGASDELTPLTAPQAGGHEAVV